MKKFEYKILTLNATKLHKEELQFEIDAKFNQWGNEGWELVKMEPVNSAGLFSYGSTTRDFFVVFKREKPSG